ncbi:furin-like protease 1, isoforms 1/1-X/2 isoform X1 [Anopheles gambiae]|uniref:furin-like protease 1, isoforms 1/1-X/2 isoform X1 n=2 Tax=Anopheles gambiae TaxID=7165 RepID=UPI002AC92528|nr:furin-like protease 1, isoforms 1/1-X/2 isoform X1 [Anopheles gambiae]XP_061504424.1 furin-like protease 1, isoforms 1/1-X/2 isoform X1 [Anopheles gambiae]XP_061504425.1 furin-like protease 1, isoforms 1/1-X/2 isoform X1 [Anopheles gambiae]XP_061504426.1 furin-like protease 1, isoforms 1/1-X/2 isoform X1 [Anopheles gambiae]XP_061504427.1 furin-like protease 1, isoforms 1/1-X/2 isoform X1 [Anopheles gambiae]XP_061504428.1 furin-like protease 1, isoforms 1/1-X/2 isoform X1 [Anopheles gambiae]
MTIKTALQRERKSFSRGKGNATGQHDVPWSVSAVMLEQHGGVLRCNSRSDSYFPDERSADQDDPEDPQNELRWHQGSSSSSSDDCSSGSNESSCSAGGCHTRRPRCQSVTVHPRYQQHHLHPRASPWSRIIQFQLVLVLSVVLVFSGINSAVNCDENVTTGVRGSGDGGELKKGLLAGILATANSSSGSSSSSSSDDEAKLLSVNEIDEMLDGVRHFTHHWAVHIPEGDVHGLADRVAAEHGFINRGKIFHEHYHFEHSRLHKRSLSPSKPHQQRLESDRRVRWAKQQRARSRQKRDFRPLTKSYQLPIQLNDPKWPEMWYLNRGNGLDMNVIPAWKEGVTGKGVVVTILDDGLESDHPDLEHNYDPYASYDVNSSDNDPMPHYDLTDSNRHGTRCAGEVAATANNSKCAVGIAYGAKVGGVRMLDGDVTDIVEARSLGHNSQHIDIYSASWGPDDDGKTVDGPGELATRAFIEGVRNGRGGKGSIFIWASGNGGREHDNCNCDGYTNSIWTLSISSTSQEGQVPWFSEMCSSTLATTYSSGNTNEKQVITTDLHHTCTSSHTGTSASAPLAAGIAALVLEANRNLTWRDLQHIVVRTAKPGNLIDPNWSVNGVGRRVSHSFGYGLMDAAAMVRLARTWKTVPEQQVCEINARHLDKQIPPRTKVTLQLIVEHCMGVNYLEHVQAKITLTSQRRGDIKIFLTSPSGTRVTLLTPRSHDLSRSGFNQWPFMSVHTWGEAPHGTWQLEIHNEGRLLGYSVIRGWSLVLYGTSIPPDPNDPPNVSRPYSTPTPALPPILPAAGFNSYTVSGGSKNYYSSSSSSSASSSSSSSSSSGIAGASSASSSSVATKPNRKQQQQLQYQTQYHQTGSSVSVQYGMTPAYSSGTSSSSSSSSNNSGNSNRGNKGKSNKNKSNKNSSKTTTARPSSSSSSAAVNQQTTVNMYLNNYGGGSSSAGGRKNSSSKQKPPPPLQTINYGKGDKYHAATSNIQDKQIAIKAPKQVKQNGFPSKSVSSSGSSSGAAAPASSSSSSSSSSSTSGGSGRKTTTTTATTAAGGSGTSTTLSSSSIALQSVTLGGGGSGGSMPPAFPPGHGGASTVSLGGTTVTASPTYNDRYPAASSINARIPKVFQQYDKIQQFYPELQPYSSIRDEHGDLAGAGGQQLPPPLPPPVVKLSAPSASGTGNSNFQQSGKGTGAMTSGTRLPAPPGIMLGSAGGGIATTGGGGTTSLGKPSRAKIFFPDSDIIDAIPRKISSSLQPIPPSYVSSPYYSRTQSSFISSSNDQKHGKAQITQWDLIFYGTETPAQPNDPVRFGKPGYDSNFGGEMEHNALEFDSGVTSDQWRDMQQIGEGHSEVQRTSSNDVTTVSCARFDAASCIECKSTAYHYKGRCYIQCPPGTYPSALLAPESNGTAASHRADIDEIAINGQRPLSPSSLRRRRQEQHVVAAALMNGASSAEASQRSVAHTTNPVGSPQCLQCHTTCLKCTGPQATDCLECQAAFRFQPIASGGESRICVSINDKRPGQPLPVAGPNNGSAGRVKAPDPNNTEHPPPGTASSSGLAPIYGYLPPVVFLAGVLLVAFVAIYVLWVHCFHGSPGIGEMSGPGHLAFVGDGGDGGTGSGLTSIRYDRVHTNEQEEEDEEEEYEMYGDDESASSGDDEGDLLPVSTTQTVAPTASKR